VRRIGGIIPYVGRLDTVRVLGSFVALGVSVCSMAACTQLDQVTEAITPSSPPVTRTAESPSPAKHPLVSIETPLANGEVSAPVSVTGIADVEGGVTVRVLDGSGAELAAIDVEVDCGKRCPGTFATELFFFVDRREPGSIEVSGTTEDGDIASASVPVVLFPV